MGIVLSWTNEAESSSSGASVTVDSESGDLSARNLLTPQIASVWRSGTWGSGNTMTVSADLGASKTIKVIAIAAPRDQLLPSTSATIALNASTSGITGTDALNVGAAVFDMRPWGVWGWKSATGITARYVRLRFVGGSASDTYLQLGRLWIGDALITTHSHSYGNTRSFHDPGLSNRAGLSGVRYSLRGKPYRTEKVTLPALNATEASTFVTAVVTAGSAGQVFFAREEETLGDGLFGELGDQATHINRQLEDLWSADLQIEEDA